MKLNTTYVKMLNADMTDVAGGMFRNDMGAAYARMKDAVTDLMHVVEADTEAATKAGAATYEQARWFVAAAAAFLLATAGALVAFAVFGIVRPMRRLTTAIARRLRRYNATSPSPMPVSAPNSAPWPGCSRSSPAN